MKPCPGTYVLVMDSAVGKPVGYGRRGMLELEPGYYLYVGSAFGPGGLRARVGRHCRRVKKPHWHIDYLRAELSIQEIWYSYAHERLEHRWASVLSRSFESRAVPGFGCSDCSCESHLFFLSSRPSVEAFRRASEADVQSSAC